MNYHVGIGEGPSREGVKFGKSRRNSTRLEILRNNRGLKLTVRIQSRLSLGGSDVFEQG